MEQIFKNDKKLYHIQATTEWSDNIYDIFVFADHEPTKEEVQEAYIDDRDAEELGEAEIADFMNNYEIYTVWTTEIGAKNE